MWRANPPAPMFRMLVALADGARLGDALQTAADDDGGFQRGLQEWAGGGRFTAIPPPG